MYWFMEETNSRYRHVFINVPIHLLFGPAHASHNLKGICAIHGNMANKVRLVGYWCLVISGLDLYMYGYLPKANAVQTP